ncbi:hypothetical protein IW136_005242, partial [Coemansia sp. RSA 678]
NAASSSQQSLELITLLEADDAKPNMSKVIRFMALYLALPLASFSEYGATVLTEVIATLPSDFTIITNDLSVEVTTEIETETKTA